MSKKKKNNKPYFLMPNLTIDKIEEEIESFEEGEYFCITLTKFEGHDWEFPEVYKSEEDALKYSREIMAESENPPQKILIEILDWVYGREGEEMFIIPLEIKSRNLQVDDGTIVFEYN